MTTATAVCITERCTRTLRDWELDARMLICSPCLSQMRGWLGQIPAAMVVLRDGSMQRERTGDGGRVGTRTAPLPCREDVLSFVGPAAAADVHDPHGDQVGIRPIIGTLGDWTRLVCEERRLNGPAQWTETALASWLLPHVGFASTQPWVDQLHRELRDMTWAIRGIARVNVSTRPISRPCPRCDSLTLTKRDHDLYTRCSNDTCEAIYLESELNDDAARRAAA